MMWKATLRVVAVGVLLAAPVKPEAAVLESPAQDAAVSGIGFISGWKCNAKHITVTLDGGEPIPVAMRQPRGDLLLNKTCGETIEHGFIQQINWGYVGDGEHEMVAYDEGVEFARSTFSVGTTGEEFLTEAQRRSSIINFPTRGEDTVLEWTESTQHFEILTVFESPVRSVYDRDWWRQFNHEAGVGTYATEEFLYAKEPAVATCEPGELAVGARNRALTAINQVRGLHGLSAVAYSTHYNPQVQATALLGAANTAPITTVTPDFACYTEEGAVGGQTSNLWALGGNVDPAIHMTGWVARAESTRRWVLNPFATDFAYGQVEGFGVYKVLGYLLQPYQVPPIAVDYVAYPFEFYPFNLVARSAPWSFAVIEDTEDDLANQGDYFSRATITVRRMGDDVELRVTDIDREPSPSGVANVLSWRVEGWEYDRAYEVEITGVSLPSGSHDYRYFVVVEREELER